MRTAIGNPSLNVIAPAPKESARQVLILGFEGYAYLGGLEFQPAI